MDESGGMKKPDPHYRHRFPAGIIAHAVWLYHVFRLSLRDVELILVERGVLVTHEPSAAGAGSLARALPAACVAGDRGRATHGISTRCSSASGESGIACSERLTRTARCSTFSSSGGEMPRRPGVSSRSGPKVCDTGPGLS